MIFQFHTEFDLKPLIQARQHDLMTDPFQCMAIKPLYVKCDNMKTSSKLNSNQRSPLKSDPKAITDQHTTLIGISVLLATINDGYLYQFTNNGKYIQIRTQFYLLC